jgi:hypothetical protein
MNLGCDPLCQDLLHKQLLLLALEPHRLGLDLRTSNINCDKQYSTARGFVYIP